MRALLFFFALALTAFSLFPVVPAHAADKPGLVLLPIQGTGMSQADRDQYRGAQLQSMRWGGLAQN